jgi:hypothetical protein
MEMREDQRMKCTALGFRVYSLNPGDSGGKSGHSGKSGESGFSNPEFPGFIPETLTLNAAQINQPNCEIL